MAAALHDPDCPFAICFGGDGYSTGGRIMGRQAAGEAFLKSVARTWSTGTVRAVGYGPDVARQLHERLQADGFRGRLVYGTLPDGRVACDAGSLYYPSPPVAQLAAMRNAIGPTSFSLMGVTHTLCSSGATSQIAALTLPPFQPWDALICTSRAAQVFVRQLHEEVRQYWREEVGATRFVEPQLPVIPLGVDVQAFAGDAASRAAARQALGLQEAQTAFLFAGRLAFHAKAHPAPLYQALERIGQERLLVCIEAGVFPGEAIADTYAQARQALAPSVRFIHVDGRDAARYAQAWQAADVFVSLADNLQETYGLTPVEAMAAGLPVVVSDWNGYKDTVRDGVDGWRVPTVLPPAGSGHDLAWRHALGQDDYDRYIARACVATVVDPGAIEQALRRLAADPGLRQAMGAAGRARAREAFDWPVILRRYAELATQLGEIRRQGAGARARPWPPCADPFHRFGHYASHTLAGHWPVRAAPLAGERLSALLGLSMATAPLRSPQHHADAARALVTALADDAPHTVHSVLAAAGQATSQGVLALMWLWKFDLVRVQLPGGEAVASS